MGVQDDNIYPWMKKEKSLILDVIKLKGIVMGICLGSQLIADAHGSKIFKNKYKEIGWHKIILNQSSFQENLNLKTLE